ncbi:hypothetical protein HUG10_15740 [Halorarum halophilum]|uniref:Uncharacterized protein n=1 Tax=Halorarum halophilum TaxID=2743090 RepID=A0A7D5GDG0_9EURY|nr:hypothetical protein [Halobaculum halophilum]QLG28905.1 hypothetical protein HUG10_15740 [Halobaculum halophilum]
MVAVAAIGVSVRRADSRQLNYIIGHYEELSIEYQGISYLSQKVFDLIVCFRDETGFDPWRNPSGNRFSSGLQSRSEVEFRGNKWVSTNEFSLVVFRRIFPHSPG